MDVEEEFKKLETSEFEDVQNHAAIQRIIQSASVMHKEFRFGELSIRIRPAIPRDLRRTVTQLKQIATGNVHEDDDDVLLDRSEQLFYQFLARMCLDEPFNSTSAWEYIDDQTGSVPNIAVQIIQLVTEDEAKVAEFRSEP